MKKKIIVGTLILVGLGVFISVIAKANWSEILDILSVVTLGKFLLFLIIAQLSYALFTLRWKIILKTHGHQLSFWKLWLYRASGYGVSYITPTQVGGEPIRIYFLNENHDISLPAATASVLFDKLLEISTFLIFVSSGILVVGFTNILPQSSWYPIVGLMGLFILLVSFIFKKLYDGTGFLTHLFQKLRLHKIRGIKHYQEKIYRTERLIMDFLSHAEHKKTTLPLLVILSIGAWACTIIEYYFIIRILGYSFGIFETFLISTIPLMAYLIPIPGGLGMLEGAQISLFGVLGHSASLALAAVMLVRVKELFFSGIGFGYALTHGLTLLGKEKPPRPIRQPSRIFPRKIFPTPAETQAYSDHQQEKQSYRH